MKMKKIISVALLGAMTLSVAGCALKIETVKKGDFKDAIEEVIDEGDYAETSNNIYYYGDNFFIDYYELDDEDDAADAWEDIYDVYEDMIDHSDFEGKRKTVSTSSYGYILLDGECDDDDFLRDVSGVQFLAYGENYYYGGIFYCEDQIIIVMTLKDKDGNREDIDTILDALGYPKP